MKKCKFREAKLRVKVARESQWSKRNQQVLLANELMANPPEFTEMKDLAISHGLQTGSFEFRVG